MSTKAKASFQIDNWDEQEIFETDDGSKVTRAQVSKSFSGELEGEGTVEWLMGYDENGKATFVGLERIVGTLGGKQGSFVLQHSGSFDGKTAKAERHDRPGLRLGRPQRTEGRRNVRGRHGRRRRTPGHARVRPLAMDDPAAHARALIDANLYMVLGTADEDGLPWATPVYYAPFEVPRVLLGLEAGRDGTRRTSPRVRRWAS